MLEVNDEFVIVLLVINVIIVIKELFNVLSCFLKYYIICIVVIVVVDGFEVVEVDEYDCCYGFVSD